MTKKKKNIKSTKTKTTKATKATKKIKTKGKKRRSMAEGTRRATQAARTGVVYLNLPKDVKLFKEEKDKRYRIDHIPYIITEEQINVHPEKQNIESDIWWRRPYKLHKNIGPDRLDVVCPTSVGKSCIICEDKQKIYEDPHGDEEVAKAMRPKDRVLYAIIPRRSKDYTEEPHLWDIGYHAYGKELAKELDYNDIGCPADLENGHTVESRFSEEKIGKGGWIKCDRIDFRSRDDFDEDILDIAPNLDDCLIILSEKELKKIYKGMDSINTYNKKAENTSSDNEDDEDEIDEDEEEIEEEDDEEEPEDDEEDDEEEDDEEEDDEEEDDEEITLDDIMGMKKKELDDVCNDYDIKIPLKKKKGIKNYRLAVIDSLELNKDVDEEDNEDNEDNECPHGHTFGDDNGEYDECSDCDVYEDCLDALD